MIKNLAQLRIPLKQMIAREATVTKLRNRIEYFPSKMRDTLRCTRKDSTTIDLDLDLDHRDTPYNKIVLDI